MMSTHVIGGNKNLINTSNDGSWFQSVAVIPKPGGGELLVLPNGDIRAFVQDVCEARDHGILSYISSDAGKTWTEEAIADFVNYYNHRRCHKTLGNVTADDVLRGRREGILIKRREVKAQTLASRKRYNHLLRESYNTAISP